MLGAGETAEITLEATRTYWLHVAQGSVDVDGRALSAGDALGLVEESGVRRLQGRGDGFAEVLLFDLPA